jgi:hypothetical protein
MLGTSPSKTVMAMSQSFRRLVLRRSPENPKKGKQEVTKNTKQKARTRSCGSLATCRTADWTSFVFSPSAFSFFVTSCLASVRHTQNSGFQVDGVFFFSKEEDPSCPPLAVWRCGVVECASLSHHIGAAGLAAVGGKKNRFSRKRRLTRS